MFRRTRDVAETARVVGLSETLVGRALNELVPDFEVLARVPRDPSKKYSIDDLMAALREAADMVPGILTVSGYDAFVAAHPTLASNTTSARQAGDGAPLRVLAGRAAAVWPACQPSLWPRQAVQRG